MKEECIRIYANMYNYEVVADIDTIKKYDDYAKNDIIHLQTAINRMQEYRSKLYEHAQKLATAEYMLRVSIRREKRYYQDNKVILLYQYCKGLSGRRSRIDISGNLSRNRTQQSNSKIQRIMQAIPRSGTC